ncbi:MAG: metal-sensitive transcriptional regulator [Firmicutes bacterium]|nr:metal-sensitive transcriptional regulator [Bacillota bacterium]
MTEENQRDIEKLLQRMRRIEGQARGVQRMLEEGRECEEIIQQLVAMRAALSKAAMAIIGEHLEICLLRDGQDPKEVLEKAKRIFMQFS